MASVTVVAGQPSAKIWEDAGFGVCSTIQEATQSDQKPDVVITGLSSPRSSGVDVERDALLFTIQNDIPVVFMVDEAGCDRRERTIPDLYLAPNELAKQIIERRLGRHTPKIAVVGDNAAGITVPEDVSHIIDGFRASGRRTVVMAAGKDTRTTDIVKYTMSCLALIENEGSVILPSIHPGTEKSVLKEWEDAITDFGKRNPGSVMRFSGVNGDQLAAAADMTITVGGSLARVAAYNGKIPVLVTSDAIRELLSEEVGQEHHLLVEWNLAQELNLESNPQLFQDLVEVDKDLQKSRWDLFKDGFPFSPEMAADAILDLIG